MLKEGDRIPEFEVTDQDGNTVTEKNFEGRRIVLYFYPKDSTPGCTAEACNLRDNFDALKEAGYEIYGVSKDSQASHQKFIGKYSLPFTLLSDPSTQMLQAFGAWGEKKMYGKVTVGTIRKTFIIAADGTVERIIGKVDTKNHTSQILG
ncbi:MAG TPA: thioredoxin-dependent thiol peroxidase [Candidatus Cryptobacteroides intestinipullorum]|nr:thioredoxin-dependent thiol peroxidase [Candidatus Cryptobacteroides intestinipullorum]